MSMPIFTGNAFAFPCVKYRVHIVVLCAPLQTWLSSRWIFVVALINPRISWLLWYYEPWASIPTCSKLVEALWKKQRWKFALGWNSIVKGIVVLQFKHTFEGRIYTRKRALGKSNFHSRGKIAIEKRGGSDWHWSPMRIRESHCIDPTVLMDEHHAIGAWGCNESILKQSSTNDIYLFNLWKNVLNRNVSYKDLPIEARVPRPTMQPRQSITLSKPHKRV